MKKILLPLIAVTVLISACKREQQFSRFSTNILAPIANTSLDLGDLVNDSVLVPDANGALRLMYDYELYKAKLADYFVVPDTQRQRTFSLQQLKLADQEITSSVPLFLVFNQAISLHGSSAPIPAMSISNVAEIPIDGSAFFKEATLNSGTMELTIENGYPVELKTLIFTLRNETDKSVIQTDTFTNIPPGTKQTKIINLAGKNVYASMEAVPQLLETYASNGAVTINAYATTSITVAVKNLKPQTAIAKFPPQSVISEDQIVVYEFGGPQVKYMDVKSGRIRFDVVSTVEEEMNVDYRIPYATKNGIPFHETFKVPPAPAGGTARYTRDFDISGYKVDLRGKNPALDDTVNSFYNVLDVTIDSTGIERNISLNDSIYVYLGLLDIIPSYAQGYFGQSVFDIGPATLDFDFFQNSSGSLSFEDIDVSLILKNGIGADGEVDFNQIIARNTPQSKAVQLTGSGLAGPHLLSKATYPPLTPSTKVINLNSSNSNIKPFFELFPDKIDYDIKLRTNPNGFNGLYNDFITDQSEFSAALSVDVPMSVAADELTLMDTVNFDFASMERSDKILEGVLNIVADNGFPLQAKLQIYLLNENDFIMDSLVTDGSYVAAAPTDANGVVTQKLRSVVKAKALGTKMETLRYTKKILIKAVLDTPKTGGTYWKMYKSYTFDLSISGDFIYDQNY
ncbi:MAG: hypothetical protein EP332_06850 [Bacteroidetes bacterium]|nr:MAG: hypothetical protein EP332_06850 [Bacteroidota bacterium]